MTTSSLCAGSPAAAAASLGARCTEKVSGPSTVAVADDRDADRDVLLPDGERLDDLTEARVVAAGRSRPVVVHHVNEDAPLRPPSRSTMTAALASASETVTAFKPK